jgi:hypothetical protein
LIAIALLALLVRLLIIASSHGGDDLRMYTYFSRLPLHGSNPFAPPHGGQFPAIDSNNAPLEVALFSGLLALHDSPATLRLLFALADVAVILLVGMKFARPWHWRLGFVLFYAFSPLVLVAWTTYAEDKTLLFAGICVWILALERRSEVLAWGSACALGAFKFLGAFALPALALDSFRRHRWKMLIALAVFLGVLALSNLPWFPHSLEAFSRRNARLGIDPPIHASPMLLISRLHLYAPIEAKLLTLGGILAVTGAFALGRIDIREAVVFSLFAGYVFLPDDAFNRLLLITLPVMLLLELSRARWILLWVLSSATALGAVVATRGPPSWLSGIASTLRAIFGHEATVPHVLWMSLLPAVVLVLYIADRASGRAPVRRAAAPLAVSSARSKAATIAS